MKINKVHNGKEFNSFFQFVGKVHKHSKFKDGQNEVVDIFRVTETKTKKPRKVLVFEVETAKDNKIKVELNAMEMPFANAYSSTNKHNFKVKWEDRFDKTKYPDETYHLIDTDWDKIDKFADEIKEGSWVEVRGKYEFDKSEFEGKEYLIVKRMINTLTVIEDGAAIKVGNGEITYTTDFASENFVEINRFNLELGIRSVYQDEKTQDTKVNGVFLDYGKERSVPKDIELMVYYTPSEKKPLADAFAALNRFDVVEVYGQDNNRVEYGDVIVESKVNDDPFADVEETQEKTKRTVVGSKKGLEILGVINGTYQRGLLTEEEITPNVTVAESNPFADPFANDGSPIDISDSDLPF